MSRLILFLDAAMASVGFVNREGRFDMNQRLRQVVFLTLLLGLGGLGTGSISTGAVLV